MRIMHHDANDSYEPSGLQRHIVERGQRFCSHSVFGLEMGAKLNAREERHCPRFAFQPQPSSLKRRRGRKGGEIGSGIEDLRVGGWGVAGSWVGTRELKLGWECGIMGEGRWADGV